MGKTIVNRFEEIITPTTMNLPDEGLVFHAQRVGPKIFRRLRKSYYGKGFRMPTMPELVSLIHASFGNQLYETAKNVIKTLRKNIIGNTAVHYFPEGMFAEDIPEIKGHEIVTPTFKVLEKKLGSHEERGVVFSDNGKIRFTPYNYIRKAQLPLQLSTNTGIIAWVGGEENAEKLTKASEHYDGVFKPYFSALENVGFPQTRVASLGPRYLNSRLSINANYSQSQGYGFSFGVREIK